MKESTPKALNATSARNREDRMKEKTYVEDIDRSIYDIKVEEKDVFKVEGGLTP